jgi:hypothetical protein
LAPADFGRDEKEVITPKPYLLIPNRELDFCLGTVDYSLDDGS